MGYIASYLLVGVLWSLIFDVLNETFLVQEEKEKITWGIRIISILIWPYILGVFIKYLVGFYHSDSISPEEEIEE